MFNKFKKGHKVIVYGTGKIAGRFYKNIPGIVIECDPYFRDYLVRFKDGSEDWISKKYLRKPYSRNKKRS